MAPRFVTCVQPTYSFYSLTHTHTRTHIAPTKQQIKPLEFGVWQWRELQCSQVTRRRQQHQNAIFPLLRVEWMNQVKLKMNARPLSLAWVNPQKEKKWTRRVLSCVTCSHQIRFVNVCVCKTNQTKEEKSTAEKLCRWLSSKSRFWTCLRKRILWTVLRRNEGKQKNDTWDEMNLTNK